MSNQAEANSQPAGEEVFSAKQVNELVKALDSNIKTLSTKVDEALTPREIKEQRAREEEANRAITKKDLEELKKNTKNETLEALKTQKVVEAADAAYDAVQKAVKNAFKANDVKWSPRYQNILDQTIVEVIEECTNEGIQDPKKVHNRIKKEMLELVRISDEDDEEDSEDSDDLDEADDSDDEEDEDDEEFQNIKSKLKNKKNTSILDDSGEDGPPIKQSKMKELMKRLEEGKMSHSEMSEWKEKLELYRLKNPHKFKNS